MKKQYRLADISVDATLKAKEALDDRRPVAAVKFIMDDLKCSLSQANELRKKLEDEMEQERRR